MDLLVGQACDFSRLIIYPDTPTSPRKLKADLFIDDRNLGGLPDWGEIYHVITEGITFREYYLSQSDDRQASSQKISFWSRLKK